MRYIEVGKIIGVFGIRGELKVKTDSDFIEERFKKNNHLYLERNNKMELITISSARLHQGFVLITINELYDINQVSGFIGLTLFVDFQSLPSLPEDEYYVNDLIGYEVFNTLGDFIGIVKDVLDLPRSAVLEIYDNQNKKILIPFIEVFVKEVKEDKIIIEEIEGLR